MTNFRAIRIDKDDHGQHADYVVMRERDLMEGDVDVDVAFSAINYKDGLAVTGKGPVVRRFPMIPASISRAASRAPRIRILRQATLSLRRRAAWAKRITEALRKRRGYRAIGSRNCRRR